MARETLHGADVAASQIQGLRNRRMAKPVGPHLQSDLPTQFANHSVKTNPRQSALSWSGSVHGPEQRTRSHPSDADPGFEGISGFQRKGQLHLFGATLP